jgi:uncharacterized protein YkwD
MLGLRIMPWLGGVGLVLLLGVTTAFAMQRENGALPLPDFPSVPAGNLVPAGALSDALTPNLPARTGQPGFSNAAGMTLPRPAPRTPAAPTVAVGSYQQVLINRDRGSARLAALSWSSCLYSAAIANARRMAAQGYISHTNGPWVDLGCRLGAQAGENVGWWSGGVDDAQLNSMFMASPDHRANIMGPYHYVATAWAVAGNGYAYIAVEFG